MLVQHLPRDSALARDLHGEAAEWSVTDHLLANAVDQLTVANWMFATVNRDMDSEPLDCPEPTPRPGTTPDADSTAPEDTATTENALPTPAELSAFFS
ncbi:hypothetical protein ACNPQM_08165 [Streptomyces sp. NPDC056231]|uniref:hypothetical protein n=1 Tax=unclassified Streptomyces TaxID=2593676 RepID=UPI0033CF0211